MRTVAFIAHRLLDAMIRVTIDSDGTPDMNTLVITGTVGSDGRAALQRWIASAQFNQARQDKQPAAGVFTTRLRSRMAVTPVR
jgi:hypothetical protein